MPLSIITKGRLPEKKVITVYRVTTNYQGSDYIKLQKPDSITMQLTKPETPIMKLQIIEGKEIRLL